MKMDPKDFANMDCAYREHLELSGIGRSERFPPGWWIAFAVIWAAIFWPLLAWLSSAYVF